MMLPAPVKLHTKNKKKLPKASIYVGSTVANFYALDLSPIQRSQAIKFDKNVEISHLPLENHCYRFQGASRVAPGYKYSPSFRPKYSPSSCSYSYNSLHTYLP